jgi:hypothetical protein
MASVGGASPLSFPFVESAPGRLRGIGSHRQGELTSLVCGTLGVAGRARTGLEGTGTRTPMLTTLNNQKDANHCTRLAVARAYLTEASTSMMGKHWVEEVTEASKVEIGEGGKETLMVGKGGEWQWTR